MHPCRPGPKDYLNAALITLGCTLFLMTGSVKSKHASADSSMFGLMLMLGYLGFDGFTSTFQDKLFKVGGGWLVAFASRLCVGGGCTARCRQAPAAPALLAAASTRAAAAESMHFPNAARAPTRRRTCLQGYQMTIYNQILYVTSFSATFSLLGLLTAGQLMPAIRWVWRHVLLPATEAVPAAARAAARIAAGTLLLLGAVRLCPPPGAAQLCAMCLLGVLLVVSRDPTCARASCTPCPASLQLHLAAPRCSDVHPDALRCRHHRPAVHQVCEWAHLQAVHGRAGCCGVRDGCLAKVLWCTCVLRPATCVLRAAPRHWLA